MAKVTVSPLSLPFTTWANSAILESDVILPQAVDEERWRAWAAQVVQIDGSAPDPMPFADWRSWALAWIEAQ